MTTAAWFQPGASGIAGDMALGALIDAGADIAAVGALCRRLPYRGWELRATNVQRAGLAGTHVEVLVDGTAHTHHRRAAEILDAIASAGLPGRVEERARATFSRLAEVEGRLHGVAPADVTFHEIGAVDSIVDIVGVCAALEVLDVEVVESGPVAVGHGTVASQHGRLPSPAPATVALLVGVPVVGVDLAMELTTPTGAALVATLSRRFGALSPMTVRAVGYGAGSRDIPGRANLVQVVIGELAAQPAHPARPAAHQPQPAQQQQPAQHRQPQPAQHTQQPPAQQQPLLLPPQPAASAIANDATAEDIVVVETTVDDVTGEQLAHAVNQLLAAGALDAWLVPVTMKKGRPGHVVTALCHPIDVEVVRAVLAAETATLGIRVNQLRRWVAARRHEIVDVDGQAVRVKVGPHRAKAEFDDVAAASKALGRPLREVAQAAEAALGSAAGAEDNLRHNER